MTNKKKGRKKGKECPYCTRYKGDGSGIGATMYVSSFPRIMNRLYVKNKNSWEAVGWYCTTCYYKKMDHKCNNE